MVSVPPRPDAPDDRPVLGIPNGLIDADRPLALLPVRIEARFDGTPDRADLLVRIYPDDVHLAARAQREAPDGEAPATGEPVPVARLLPDRWVVIGHRDGGEVLRATGTAVPESLAIGPDPDLPPGGDGIDGIVEPGLRWLVDFEIAVENGMALRIPLDPQTSRGGLDRLVVLGVKASWTASRAAEAIAEHLGARVDEGTFSFVAQGERTNLGEPDPEPPPRPFEPEVSRPIDGGATVVSPVSPPPSPSPDGPARPFGSRFAAVGAVSARPVAAPASGTSGGRPGLGDVFQPPDLAVDPELTPRPRPSTNAELLAIALGIDAGVLAGAPGADGREQGDAGSMATALWECTWGDYLGQWTASLDDHNPRIDEAQIAAARRHFLRHVRGRGPLPAIRIGRQPYGVLPAGALARWAHGRDDPFQTGLVDLLRRARPVWEDAADAIPRVGPDGASRETLLRVLGMDSRSRAFAARSFLGRHYLRNLLAFLDNPHEEPTYQDWFREAEARAREGLDALGVDGRPRLVGGVFVPDALPLDAPTVEAVLSSRLALSPNYIEALRTADPRTLEPDGALEPATLLHWLLRHSLLLGYGRAAFRLLRSHDLIAADSWWEPELTGFATLASSHVTMWQMLERSVPAVTGGEPLARWLPGAAHSDAVELRQLLGSLERLESLPTRELHRLLTETLDCASHRLDAWVTSLPAARLAEIRRGARDGVYLGGYGWLAPLRPRWARAGDVPPEASDGYIHAPSLGQASAAAILRSGYLTQRRRAPSGPLAVNLGSSRVRTALRLLEGVRQGQSLGSLLGMQLERELHERSLQHLIAPLRRVATTGGAPPVDVPTESVPPLVADGLELLREWQAERLGLGTVAPAPREREGLEAVFRSLAGSVDAVGDLLVSESVYQVVQGNPTRAAPSLNAIGRGEMPPETIELVSTPRGGTSHTNRVLTLFQAGDLTAPRPAGWPAPGTDPMSRAEPVLDAWAAALLGPADEARAVAVYVDAETGAELATRPVSLADAVLGPLEVVYLVQPASDRPGRNLERWLRHRLEVDRPGGVPDDARLDLRTGRDDLAGPDDRALADVVELATSMRELLDEARAARPADLASPADALTDSLPVADGDEMAARVDVAAGALTRARDDLDALLTLDPPPAAAVTADALLALARFGMPEAIPEPVAVDEEVRRDRWLDQARSVLMRVPARLDAMAAVEPGESAAETGARRLEALFAGLRAVAWFDVPDAGALTAAFDAPDPPGESRLGALETWVQRQARVHRGIRPLADVMLLAETIGTGQRPAARIGQLPTVDGERWIGLPQPPESQPAQPRAGLVVYGAGAVESGGPVAGLALGAWSEMFPRASRDTGLAFQFDRSGTAPPQAILVAVSPDEGPRWSSAGLEAVLDEVLDLARLRLVDPEALRRLGHWLPAILLSHNDASGDAVSSDPRRLHGE